MVRSKVGGKKQIARKSTAKILNRFAQSDDDDFAKSFSLACPIASSTRSGEIIKEHPEANSISPKSIPSSSSFKSAEDDPNVSLSESAMQRSLLKEKSLTDDVEMTVEPKRVNGRRSSAAVAEAEISKYQRSSKLLIPKAPIKRLSKDIAHKGFGQHLRFAEDAISALHEASEAYLVNLFKYTNVNCHNSRRITIMQRDMDSVLRIRGERP